MGAQQSTTSGKLSPLTQPQPAARNASPREAPHPQQPQAPAPIVDVLTCCICLEAALPFITLAPCAHFLCGACALAVADCPQCKTSIASKMHMPQVTQSVEEALRATGQPVPAYAPFVHSNDHVAWRAPGARAARPPQPPPPPAAQPAAPVAQPAAQDANAMPSWLQRVVTSLLPDQGRLDQEERIAGEGTGAAASVETPQQLLQGTALAAAGAYAAYLVAFYALNLVAHALTLLPRGAVIGIVVVGGWAVFKKLRKNNRPHA